MKPTKNRVYCPDCGRTKMLFEDEKKALNFIKFNAESMADECHGKVPTRAYFCMACAGWHLTSHETAWTCKSVTEKLMEHQERQKSAAAKIKVNEIIARTQIKLNKVDEHIRNIDILSAAKMMMTTCNHLQGAYGNYKSQEIKDLLDSTLYKCEKMLEIFSNGIAELIVRGDIALAKQYIEVLNSVVQTIQPKHHLFTRMRSTYQRRAIVLESQVHQHMQETA